MAAAGGGGITLRTVYCVRGRAAFSGARFRRHLAQRGVDGEDNFGQIGGGRLGRIHLLGQYSGGHITT